MNSCSCYGLSGLTADLSQICKVTTTIFDHLSHDIPDDQKRNTSLEIQAMLIPVLDNLMVNSYIFEGLGFADLMVQMKQWSTQQERLCNLVELAETRLDGAPYAMIALCDDLKTIIVYMSRVIHYAIMHVSRYSITQHE
jgi:hypothetical protein